jgi:predicted membrane channel-forming protein YqfA (hemolysin III family)
MEEGSIKCAHVLAAAAVAVALWTGVVSGNLWWALKVPKPSELVGISHRLWHSLFSHSFLAQKETCACT